MAHIPDVCRSISRYTNSMRTCLLCLTLILSACDAFYKVRDAIRRPLMGKPVFVVEPDEEKLEVVAGKGEVDLTAIDQREKLLILFKGIIENPNQQGYELLKQEEDQIATLFKAPDAVLQSLMLKSIDEVINGELWVIKSLILWSDKLTGKNKAYAMRSVAMTFDYLPAIMVRNFYGYLKNTNCELVKLPPLALEVEAAIAHLNHRKTTIQNMMGSIELNPLEYEVAQICSSRL